MKKLLSSIILPMLILSCNRQENKTDCANVACTMEFRSFQVNVEDKSGNTVVLDTYYTINTSNNDTIQKEASPVPGDTAYVVLDDGYTKNMLNKEIEFRFIGILNNKVVANEPFTFSADCCHISKISGKETIVTD